MASGLRQTRPTAPASCDAVALAACLTVPQPTETDARPDRAIGARSMRALVKLRHDQLEMMQHSRGALVKIQPADERPFLDLAQIGGDSPLTADYHSLTLLRLIEEFPERQRPLTSILDARRAGLDVQELARVLPQAGAAGAEKAAGQATAEQFEASGLWLLEATLRVALKPLYEAAARAFQRLIQVQGEFSECPLCGGSAWARHGGMHRCAVCETQWEWGTGCPACKNGEMRRVGGIQARGALLLCCGSCGHRLRELDAELFPHAFNPGPLVDLLVALASEPSESAPSQQPGDPRA